MGMLEHTHHRAPELMSLDNDGETLELLVRPPLNQSL
jgi:hypothetical protein